MGTRPADTIAPAAPADPPPGPDLRAAAAGALARRIPTRFLLQYCILPLELDGETAVVAAGEPVEATVVDELGRVFERPVRIVEAPAAEIQAALMADAGRGLEAAGRGSVAELEVVADEERQAFDDVRALASQAPIIKLVNVLVLEALKARASDLHIESTAEGLRVRHRIDGVLHDVARPPRDYQAAIVSRVKIMADLNIAERRLPQDGRIRLRLADREVDLRVSTLPSVHGESVVLRILDRGGGVRDLPALGMPPDVLEPFRRMTRRPDGIVLVTGPTGSGKTTTLYAALDTINSPAAKIITVEDPVEYQVEGITQIPVDRKAGFGFPTALRSILRHDPDILLVGEMRDAETAGIAIQSALTGHLVFSTLHTNDAAGGVTRLVEMGIEPYLVAATVRGVLAQRLVRRLCPACAEPHEPPAAELARLREQGLDLDGAAFRKDRGCEDCAGTGFRGRTGIYELMPVDARIRAAIVAGEPLDTIRRAALEAGMRPLRLEGLEKAARGVTTLEEVLRVTREEDGA